LDSDFGLFTTGGITTHFIHDFLQGFRLGRSIKPKPLKITGQAARNASFVPSSAWSASGLLRASGWIPSRRRLPCSPRQLGGIGDEHLRQHTHGCADLRLATFAGDQRGQDFLPDGLFRRCQSAVHRRCAIPARPCPTRSGCPIYRVCLPMDSGENALFLRNVATATVSEMRDRDKPEAHPKIPGIP
jgi:hypothetical protein